MHCPRGSATGEQQARGAPGRAAGARAAGQQRWPHQRLRPSQARGRAAGEQQARGAPGRAAGVRAAGQQRRSHQRLRLQYRPCHHTPLEPTPPQVQVRPFKPRSPCPLSIEAPPPPAPHNQLRAHTRGLGGGLPWREAAGGAAAALSSLSRHQLSSLGVCGVWPGLNQWPSLSLPHLAVSALWLVLDSWGREGGSTAAWQSHCSKGEYRDGLGLSRSLAMQQRQLTGPAVAASAAGGAEAVGEGRGGKGT
ncbi:unnamed protein product [Closterium sp. NIES-64]|nr:unnamed protein product [Closterium sp. NIES-64]